MRLVNSPAGRFLRLVNSPAGRFLRLVGGPAGRFLRLVGGPTDRFLHLLGAPAGHLLHLVGGLSDGFLALARGFVCGLPRLLGLFLHHVLYTSVLSRLIYVVPELGVGVGHLLDLGLRILGELLRKLLQLGAIALHPALYPAHRSREEVLGLLHALILRLLLEVLRLFAHFFSPLLSGLCFPVVRSEYSRSVFTLFTLSLYELLQEPRSLLTISLAIRNRTSALR